MSFIEALSACHEVVPRQSSAATSGREPVPAPGVRSNGRRGFPCNRISARRSKSPMHDQAATLRLAVFPRSGLLTDALLVLGGAAFVGLAAQISFKLGYTPVPITGQTFAVLLVGAASARRSARRASCSTCCSGSSGVPLYADHRHGWDVFSGATGGYIVGFVVAAALTGWLAERGWDKRFSSSVTAMLTGNVVIYVCGRGLAAPLDRRQLEHDAQGRALPVRARRPRQAVPRRAGAPGRLEARPPARA